MIASLKDCGMQLIPAVSHLLSQFWIKRMAVSSILQLSAMYSQKEWEDLVDLVTLEAR